MKVNFVGNFQSGYVGEVSDESHLAREIEALGHDVRRIPRDEWREYVLSMKPYPNVPDDLKADINLVAKWNGFDDGKYITYLRDVSHAPVFYWVWDYMQREKWHMYLVHASDLYLSNDTRSGEYNNISNAYYFPFDVADGSIKTYNGIKKTQNVSFFGSWVSQGNRQEWLKQINKEVPVTIFSWNYNDWPDEFRYRNSAVYGEEFNLQVARTKICLGFSVEPHSWGYWSNRTGKTLLAGGFLLYEYAPGMELFFRDGMAYFSSPEEAVEKIRYYLDHEYERQLIANKGYKIATSRVSSHERVKDLMILADRFIKKGKDVWCL